MSYSQSELGEKGGYLFKVIVVGEQAVGKSSILLQYTKQLFKNEYNVTIGVEFASKCIEIETEKDGKLPLTLQIWDTAGQETFKSLVRTFYQKSAAAFIVYNVTKRQTFEALNSWLQEIRSNAFEEIIIIVVGNQIDQDEKREVTYEEGKQYAEANGLDLFFETSAKDNLNIDEVFRKVSEKVYERFIKDKQLVGEEDQIDANQLSRASSSFNRNLIQPIGNPSGFRGTSMDAEQEDNYNINKNSNNNNFTLKNHNEKPDIKQVNGGKNNSKSQNKGCC